jgi:uncharacterized repeat protein (TIGR01451 family)
MQFPGLKKTLIGIRLIFSFLAGILAVSALLFFVRKTSYNVRAAPIPPPDGYPKLSLSTKSVTPDLVSTAGETLDFVVEILNTGAYRADGVQFTDQMPEHTAFVSGSAESSVAPAPTYDAGSSTLTWTGDVGFDSSVLITFSVDVEVDYSGEIVNEALIEHPLISEPVTVTATAIASDDPILQIEKSSEPAMPGAGKSLTYTLKVTNVGQPAINLPVTVQDKIPQNTTFDSVGLDGNPPTGGKVTWQRDLNLEHGASDVFSFTVNVDADVPSGTVITNDTYQVSNTGIGTTVGDVYTTTVVDPIFFISKYLEPDPPGANREVTYTISVLNKGSLATDLVVTDPLPPELDYVRGGSYSSSNHRVTWNLAELPGGESAQFQFTGYINDIAYVPLVNQGYKVCSAEGVCKTGRPVNSLVEGPNFEVSVELDPVAKKPGGGTGPVTPTMVIENLGPGNALNASATLYFTRVSVTLSDLIATDNRGSFDYGPLCGDKCSAYNWVGDIAYGEVITLTALGQSTKGGEEGTPYTATLEITDTLGITNTPPVKVSAVGHITHFANLVPTKTAPPYIGAGQQMTYTIQVYNSGLSTDSPPSPWLAETLPLSTTLVNVSDGGVPTTVDGRTTISWTLPDMSPGDAFFRSFSVLVDPDLVSGTLLVNQDYKTGWSDVEATGVLSNTGVPITTVVKEVGIIDSFKTVTPTLARPGPGNVFTYTVHVVNSSPSPLNDVEVYDILPWQNSTYLRDAIASAGQVISDIVSVNWLGDLSPYSTELITFSVLVDDDFEGVLTNTAKVAHPTHSEGVDVSAVAYVTNDPVLKITKTATPDPVKPDGELLYKIRVANLGQQATNLVVTDTLPVNVEYVSGSANASGELVGDQLHWEFSLLDPGETRNLTFKVRPLRGNEIINQFYGVTCAEGVSAVGPPVITQIAHTRVYLPIIQR